MTSEENGSREEKTASYRHLLVTKSAPTISVGSDGSSIIVPGFKLIQVPYSTATSTFFSDSEVAKQLFDQANAMRKAKGLNAFTYDLRLEKAAQKHADDLGAGRARPHDGLRERIYELGGFPDEPCYMTRAGMQANYSEGIENQPSAIPLDQALPFLVNSGPGEAHYDDFFDPKVTHVGIGVVRDGIGYYNVRVVLDYGIICNFKPEPEPAPRPDIERDLFDVW